MSQRIPGDAFAYYVALGADRSYQKVADFYGCSRNGVLKAASRENWVARLEAIEESIRERIDAELSDDMAEMRLRHRKLLRAMAGRAARAIQEHELNSAWEGMKAAEMVIKLERIIAGEVSDRAHVNVEQVTKQEIDRLLVRDDEAEDEPEDEAPDE